MISDNNFEKIYPDANSLNNKLKSLSTEQTLQSAQSSLQILRQAEEWYESVRSSNGVCDNVHGPIPEKYSYSMVIDSLSKLGLSKEASDLLQTMNDLSQSNPARYIKPDTMTYNSVINSFSQEQNRFIEKKSSDSEDSAAFSVDNAEEAEQLLRKMLMDYEQGLNLDALVDTTTYNTVMKVWSYSGRADAGANAERLLNEMWTRVINKGWANITPDQFSYSTVVSAWARSGLGEKGAEKSEALLEEMEYYHRKGYSGPNTYCCNAVLNAWAKSNSMYALNKAEAIIRRMEELCYKRPELAPNVISYNTLISLYARHGDAIKAEAVLDRLEMFSTDDQRNEMYFNCTPDIVSYNSVISAWSKRKNVKAAERAEKILRKIERLHADGVLEFPPDAYTYSSVITAWANSGSEKCADRADAVLKKMIIAYKIGKIHTMPTTAFNAVCNAYAKSNECNAGDRAFSIFKQMEVLNINHDVYTYTSIIDAYAKQGTEESASKALSILESLETCYIRTGNYALKPNRKTYTSVISAVSRCKIDPSRAEALLNDMESKGYDTADTVCFNAVINAWAWSSNQNDKASRVESILNKMIQRSVSNKECKPDVVTLNCILNACAFTSKSDPIAVNNAVKVAVNTYELFQDKSSAFGPPDHLSYGLLLMVLNKLLCQSNLRTDLMKNIFYQCSRAGCLNGFVVNQLKQGVSSRDLKELLGHAAVVVDKTKSVRIDKRKVPKQWSSRIVGS